MGRQDEERASREARRDLTAEPARERPHESAMAAFVAGIAYEQERKESEDAAADNKHRRS